jgi:hypothetical protein
MITKEKKLKCSKNIVGTKIKKRQFQKSKKTAKTQRWENIYY